MYNFDLCTPVRGICRSSLNIPPTPHEMGCTTAPPGHASDSLEIGFKPSSAIARTVHESPSARGHELPTPNISKVSHRRIRQTKSYTHTRKKCKTTTDSISRSRSVTNDFSPEKSSAMSLSLGGSPKWNRTPVRFLVHRCMRHKVHSTRRSSRRRSL